MLSPSVFNVLRNADSSRATIKLSHTNSKNSQPDMECMKQNTPSFILPVRTTVKTT